MRRSILMLALFTALLVVATGVTSAQDNQPILVGHLTYHTGPFEDVGPWFDGVTNFVLEIINENPPLGRELVVTHEDIGTIGEARAARKLVEFEGVDILLNPAHGYGFYRDWLLEYIASNDRPLMPSVHGGAIERTIGGTSAEPLFRGAPMDSAQAVAAVIQAQQAGVETLVIVASEIEGHQLQKNAALSAAEQLGLSVLAVIDIQSEMPTYQDEMRQALSLDPGAILAFTTAGDGGTVVKDAAAAGLSSIIIGTTEWLGESFVSTATMSAIEQLEAVWVSGFTHTDGPAWDFYQERWDTSDYADLASADNSYNLQYYDLLNVTALAIEAAGSTAASAWAEYVPLVAEGPGTVVYTYEQGIEALRNGEDIDYSGISGEMEYTETGVVSGLFGIFEWVGSGELQLVTTISDSLVLELDR